MTLPIPDFDHLPLGSVADRIRSLERDEVEHLVGHEQSQGNRLPVLEVLRSRLEQLDAGAQPSDGNQAGPHPETGITSHGTSTDPSGAAEPGPPHRHGLRGPSDL